MMMMSLMMMILRQMMIMSSQVSELVTAELYEKYERILLETQLETMVIRLYYLLDNDNDYVMVQVDVVICPRLACQCPTVIDRDTNMGQCPACHLAFCIYCR